MKKISAFLLSLAMLSAFGAGVVFAQSEPPTGSDTNPPPTGSDSNPVILPFSIQNPLQYDNIFELMTGIITNILMPVGGILAVLAFIYSGFLFVSAQGNEAKLKTAKQALLYTAVGTAVLLGSWALANLIENTIKQITA